VIYTGLLIDAHHHFWDPTPLYRRARGGAAACVKDERTCNLEAERL
jgi:predicted TIM-barrel fold metal-dependent hydrolase